MAMTMLLIMIVLMLLGFPMMVPMLVATLAGFLIYLPNLKTDIIIQQMISGISPVAKASQICVSETFGARVRPVARTRSAGSISSGVSATTAGSRIMTPRQASCRARARRGIL